MIELCLGCGEPSRTLYCESCAPPPREVLLRLPPRQVDEIRRAVRRQARATVQIRGY